MRWIFLRGLARETGHWANFCNQFEKKIPSLLFLIDLPGAGKERFLRCPLSVPAIVDFLREKHHFSPPYHILGVSLGSMLAMEWAHRHPKEVGRIVLINGSAANLSPPWRRLTPQALALFAQLRKTKTARARETLILGFITNHFAAKPQWIEPFIRIAEERPVTMENALRQLWAASQYRLKPLDVPALVLRGMGDRLAHPSCSEKIASFLRAPLQSHPTAGHDLPLDAPEWVLEKVENWIK